MSPLSYRSENGKITGTKTDQWLSSAEGRNKVQIINTSECGELLE